MAVNKMSMRPVFIVGEQRSGSNLLRLMLNQLERVCAPHPPHILQRLLPIWLEQNHTENPKASECNQRLINEAVCDLVEANAIPWRISPINRKHFHMEVRKGGPIAAFAKVMDLEAGKSSASIWVSKSMQNIRWKAEIDSHFSPASPRYLFLHRDPRDVCASFQRAIVGEKHAYSIATRWVNLQQLCLAAEADHPGQIYRVAYRSLVESPVATMRKICEFIDVDYQSNVLDFHESADAHAAAAASNLWHRVDEPITTNRLMRYRSALSCADQEIVERVACETMRQLGYPLEFIMEEGIACPFSENQVSNFLAVNEAMKRDAYARLHQNERRNEEKVAEIVKQFFLEFRPSGALGAE